VHKVSAKDLSEEWPSRKTGRYIHPLSYPNAAIIFPHVVNVIQRHSVERGGVLDKIRKSDYNLIKLAQRQIKFY
jgi:hypothetical protein